MEPIEKQLLEHHSEAQEKRRAEDAKRAAAEARKPKRRTWTTADGAFTTVATFIELAKDWNAVTLPKEDGATVQGRRKLLSQED